MVTNEGWQEKVIGEVRKLIKEVSPEVVEEAKWKKATNPKGVPVWSLNGLICTGETYKDKVKFTFAKGAMLAGKTKLFNAGEGVRRAIDIQNGEDLKTQAFKDLIRAAIELNNS